MCFLKLELRVLYINVLLEFFFSLEKGRLKEERIAVEKSAMAKAAEARAAIAHAAVGVTESSLFAAEVEAEAAEAEAVANRAWEAAQVRLADNDGIHVCHSGAVSIRS